MGGIQVNKCLSLHMVCSGLLDCSGNVPLMQVLCTALNLTVDVHVNAGLILLKQLLMVLLLQATVRSRPYSEEELQDRRDRGLLATDGDE